jgi:hypothetical protein
MKKQSELKRENWKSIKSDFLKGIPKRFKIETEGLNDETDYYHPVIRISDDIIIKGQADVKSDRVYALVLQIEKRFSDKRFLHVIGLSADFQNELLYLLENFEKLQPKIEESFEMIKKIYLMQADLKAVQDNIIETSISKLYDQSKIQDSLDNLYTVTEFIENQRLNN